MRKIAIISALAILFIYSCEESTYNPADNFIQSKGKLTGKVWVFDTSYIHPENADPGPLTMEFLENGLFRWFINEPTNDWGYHNSEKTQLKWEFVSDNEIRLFNDTNVVYLQIEELTDNRLVFTGIDTDLDTIRQAFNALYKDEGDSNTISLSGKITVIDNLVNLDEMIPVLLWRQKDNPGNMYLGSIGLISSDKKSFSILIDQDLNGQALASNEPDAKIGEAVIALVKKTGAFTGLFSIDGNTYGVVKDRYIVYWKGTNDNKHNRDYSWLWPLGFRQGYTFGKTACPWNDAYWRLIVPMPKDDIELLVTTRPSDYEFIR